MGVPFIHNPTLQLFIPFAWFNVRRGSRKMYWSGRRVKGVFLGPRAACCTMNPPGPILIKALLSVLGRWLVVKPKREDCGHIIVGMRTFLKSISVGYIRLWKKTDKQVTLSDQMNSIQCDFLAFLLVKVTCEHKVCRYFKIFVFTGTIHHEIKNIKSSHYRN